MTGWRLEPLRDLGSWKGGGTPAKSRLEFWHDGDVPWLSPKDMGPDVLRSTKDHITTAAVAASATRLVKPDSVAVVVRSGILERTIPVAVVPFATTLNQDMKALECRPDVDPRWVAWGLRASEQRLLRTARKAGTTVASLEWSRVLDWSLPVPRLEEQRRIVAILEDHLSRLDAANDNLDAAEARTWSMVAASARGHVEGALHTATHSTVGAHAVLIEYGTSTKTSVTATEVPVLRMGNIKHGRISWDGLKYLPGTHHEFPRLLLQSGDLLFNRTNSAEHVGKCAVFRDERTASFASYLIRARFDLEVLPEWANLVINSPQGRHYVASVVSQQVGQANVNGAKLRAFPLPVPTRGEQTKRVRHHEALCDAAEATRANVLRARRRAAALRSALLRAAFSGRLTGRSSDLDRAEGMAFA